MKNKDKFLVPENSVKVYFHGAMAIALCDELDAYVSTPHELIKLMMANNKAACMQWMATGKFVFVLNGDIVTQKNMQKPLESGDVIHVVPVVAGAFFGIVLGIIAIVLAVTALALVFMKPPKNDSAGKSTSYQRPKNVDVEGSVVSVVYGQTRTGTIRVSDNTFLGRSNTLNAVTPTIPFLNGSISFEGLQPDTGSSGTAPVVSSDVSTKQEIHVFSEGEIEELSLDNVLMNGTSLQTGGSYNFDNVRAQVLLGEDPQDMPSWIDVSAAPVDPAVNVKLSTDRTITTLNDALDSARILISVASFFETRKKKPAPTIVQLKIEKRLTSGGAWSTVSSPIINGEYFATQQFQYTVNLDPSEQYDIAVSRITAEVNTEEKQNSIQLENIIEIKKDRVTFDGSAVLLLEYTNEAFGGQNPTVEVIPKGKKIKLPSNYNPVTRVYTGVWDGSYSGTLQYSNNPPFCCQDFIENTIYGLGEYIGSDFDKFEIYALGQYCDVSVDDGQGGTEPRYTLNIALNERKKSIQVLRDIASNFRAQALWDGSQVTFYAEQSTNPSFLVNNSNVLNGNFEYAGPNDEFLPNSVRVTFKDENNTYEESSVVYQNHASILAYGLNEKEYEGVGITSPGQALRNAKFIALSDGKGLQYTGVEDMSAVLPGAVGAVFDELYMSESDRQGRVSNATSSTTSKVYLDRSFTVESGRTYELYVMLPDGTLEIKSISNSVGTYNYVDLSSALSSAPQGDAAWGIAADNLAPQLYIVQSRGSNEDGVYPVSAIEYDGNKYSIVEDDLAYGAEVPTTNPNTTTVPKPINLTAQVNQYPQPNGVRNDIFLQWERPSGDYIITGYDVFYSVDGSAKQQFSTSQTETTATLTNVNDGNYVFYVRAKTFSGQSDFAILGVTVDDDTSAFVGSVTGLQLFGQGNSTTFNNRDAKFTWRYTSALSAEEIGSERYGAASAFQDDFFKSFIVEIYDTDTGALIRTENVITNEYTYTLEKNVEDGGPYREFRIEVTYLDKFNNKSSTAKLTVDNPAPPLPDNIVVTGLVQSILASFNPSDNLLDFAGVLVWSSTTSGFTPIGSAIGEGNVVEDTQSSIITFPATPGEVLYVKIAQYDTYSKNPDDLNISGQYEVTARKKADTAPPSIPANLALTSPAPTTGENGNQIVEIIATWDKNSEDDMNFYDAAIKETAGSNFINSAVPQPTTSGSVSYSWQVQPNTSYDVKIRAIDDIGNKSGYTDVETLTSAVDAVAPGDPSDFSVVASFKNIFLSWTNPSDNDFSHAEIYQGTTSVFGSATLIGSDIKVDFHTVSGLDTSTEYFFWVKAVDTSGNKSSEVGPQSATTIQTTSADYQALSIVNAAIANAAIDEAKIANLAVTNAKIANATIESAKIAEVEADKILVSGSTYLSDWRNGTDATKIDGGNIYANTVAANTLVVGARGLTIDGLQFEPNDPASNRVSWSAGTISYINDAGTATTVSISSGSSGTYSASTIYAYWVKGATSLSTTTTIGTAFGANNVVLATYNGNVDLVANYGRTIIDGSQIIANSITSSNLVTGTAVITQSAQIANAIVDTAQLANAAITNAKIDNLTVENAKIANASLTKISSPATGTDTVLYQTAGPYLLGTAGLSPENPGNSIIIATFCIMLKSASASTVEFRVKARDSASPTPQYGEGEYTVNIRSGDRLLITPVFRFTNADTDGPYYYEIEVLTSGENITRDGSRSQIIEYIK